MSYCIFTGTDISIQTRRCYVTFGSKISSYIVQTTAYCLRREDLWLDARQFEEGVGSTIGIMHSGDSGCSVNYYSNLNYRCIITHYAFYFTIMSISPESISIFSVLV